MNVDLTAANENMDMPAHVQTYNNFMRFVRFGITAVVVLLIFMALVLT